MFSPYSYPWFIIPCGILILIASIKMIKRKKEMLTEKNIFCLSIHGAFFIVLNLIFIISNFYLGGFPWSLLIINTWTLILSFRIINIFAKNTKYNSAFFKHFLIYSSFGIFLFLIYCYSGCKTVRIENYDNDYASYINRYQDIHWGHLKNHHINSHHPKIEPEFGRSSDIKRNQPDYKLVTICERNHIFGLFFYFIPMSIWSIILFIHFLLSNRRIVRIFGYRIERDDDEVHKEEEFEIIQKDENENYVLSNDNNDLNKHDIIVNDQENKN